MTKLLLTLMLCIVWCVGTQYKVYGLEDDLIINNRIDKVLKSKNGVHIQRYGIRIIHGDKQTKVGLYKIIVGDLKELNKIYKLNILQGFAGIIIYPTDSSDKWNVIRQRHFEYSGEPPKNRILSREIVIKKDLPNILNAMPNYLLKLIENVVIYEKNGCIVIYVLSETKLDELNKLFKFVVKHI